jgi:hypothetical protein
MAKTRADVILLALRRLGVVAEDEAASDAMVINVGDVLDTLFEEVEASKTLTWDLTAVPGSAYNALANLLAVEVAPQYPPAVPPYPRSIAWQRLMGVIRPDDRADIRDLDDDGIVDEDEEDAGARALYF